MVVGSDTNGIGITSVGTTSTGDGSESMLPDLSSKQMAVAAAVAVAVAVGLAVD